MSKKKESLLFVCLGNICRSPAADGLARKWVADRDLNWHIDSAGTSGWHAGEPPHREMIRVASERHAPIEFLRSRQVLKSDFENFDYIVAMDHSNYENLLALAPAKFQGKIHLLLDSTERTNKNVPDPYYGGPEGFVRCFEIVQEGIEAFMPRVEKKEI